MHRGALSGRRILELADEKGVYCGKLFADMGAEVIKIERPGGDATRSFPPCLRRDPSQSLFFLAMNTSKKSITLDLTHEEGRGIFRRLAAGVDALIETTAPGALDAIDLGYAALRELQPRLVVTSITGFGQSGPRRDWKISDLVANALGGVAHVTGAAADPPVTLAGSQAYLMASTLAASSTMMALLHAARSGEGQHLDISIYESTLAFSHISGVGKWLDDGMIPRRMGTSLFASVPSGAYPSRDGQIYLMVNRPAHWQALADWIHDSSGEAAILDPLFSGPSAKRIPYRDMIDHFIVALTRRYTVQEAYREGQRRHLAMTPVHSPRSVVAEPQLAARDFFVPVDHGDLGTIRYPGAPYRHAATPWAITTPAPRAGQHNDEIYLGELEMTRQRLDELRGTEVI
jgi:crotonobetainyl-CoA:carnitine CoA-transferase CaiB-like acyl-CoA transferase